MIAAAAGTVLLPQAETQAKKPAPQKQPNILVILADDLGFGDLSCQYAKDIQTPHIDQLFEHGVRLDNFYAGSNVSSPSRAGLLTGRYPILVGVPGVIRESRANNWGWLSPDAGCVAWPPWEQPESVARLPPAAAIAAAIAVIPSISNNWLIAIKTTCIFPLRKVKSVVFFVFYFCLGRSARRLKTIQSLPPRKTATARRTRTTESARETA